MNGNGNDGSRSAQSSAATTASATGADSASRDEGGHRPGGHYVKIYIGNLDFRVGEKELREHFRDYTKDLIQLTLKTDRGFAFMAFPSEFDGQPVGECLISSLVVVGEGGLHCHHGI